MLLKVGRKYKRVGTGPYLTPRTGDIVIIRKISQGRIYHSRTHFPDDDLSLDSDGFIKEYKLLKKQISFKGLL